MKRKIIILICVGILFLVAQCFISGDFRIYSQKPRKAGDTLLPASPIVPLYGEEEQYDERAKFFTDFVLTGPIPPFQGFDL
ncbi:MAG: hypothetical protein JSW40_07680 [Candidatus Omnitrophota bacterium]|nr:MAG: hypothetical protein JSW40_07680 [Candidatus Omnitrophota bacterium]